MTKQEQLKKLFKAGHIYNVHAIAEKSGLRKLKLHEFIKDNVKLSDTEATSVLRLVNKYNNILK